MALPPDLDRLGSALTNAAARAGARRRRLTERRRRMAASLAAGLLVFAAMTPSHLDGADNHPQLLQLASAPAEASMACDQPRGHPFEVTEPCVVRKPQPQAARN